MKNILNKLILSLGLSVLLIANVASAQVYVQAVCTTYQIAGGGLQNNCGQNAIQIQTPIVQQTVQQPVQQSYVAPQPVNQYLDLCNSLTRTMGAKTRGRDVRLLQLALGQEGIAYLKITGTMNLPTRKAIKIFQQRNGIKPTGFVGRITLAAMQSYWCIDAEVYQTPVPVTQVPQSYPTYPTNYPVNPVNVTASIYASQTTINSGQPTTLNWTSTNANYCNVTANNISVNSNQSPNGSATVYPQTGTNYVLNCYNTSNQNASASVYINVNSNTTNPPTLNISPSTANVSPGQQTNFLITGTNISNSQCTIYVSADTNVSASSEALGNSGYSFSKNFNLSASQNRNIQVTCTGLNGQNISANANLTVSGNNSNIINLISNSNGNVTISYQQSGCGSNSQTCDPLLSSINWGDGQTTAASSLTTQTHQYTNSGSFTITRYVYGQVSGTLQVSVQVNSAAAPTCSVTANPTSVTVGGTTVLNFTSQNALYVLENYGTQQATSGTLYYTVRNLGTNTYTLKPVGPNGFQGSCSVNVTGL